MFGLELARNIGTGEGPVEDGNWAGQHSLHWFLCNALSVAAPFDSNRVRTTNIGNDDGRADISRAVALNPTVLSEDKSVELFTEVLNHVVSLRFTVDEEIKSDLLLEGDDALNLLLDEALVLLLGDLVLVQFGTSTTDLLGLGEGSDGGGGELGQAQLLFLDLLTNSEGAPPLQHVGSDGSNPLADGIVGGMLEFTSFGDRDPVGLESTGDGRILGPGKDGGDDMNLRSLLESEGEPILLFGSQLLLRSEGDGSVKEGRRGSGDDTIDTKTIDGGLTSLDGSREIRLPDVTARNETEREEKGGGLDSSDSGLKLSRSAVEINVKTGDGELGNEVDIRVETTEVGGQEDFRGNRGKFSISGVELALELETSIKNEHGLIDLNPLSTSSLEFSQELLVERENLGEEGDRGKVWGGILRSLTQPQISDGAQDNRAGRDTEGLGLVELFNRLIEVELEVGGLGQLGHNKVVVRIEPDGKCSQR